MAILRNGMDVGTWTEQGLSKRRERVNVKYTNIAPLLAAFLRWRP
jgi:hypothetical protein